MDEEAAIKAIALPLLIGWALVWLAWGLGLLGLEIPYGSDLH